MNLVSGLKPKSPRESLTENVEVVLPNDANPLGNALGGRVMHWIDLVGAVVAFRHCRQPVVTASMEHLDFLSPIRIGQIVLLKGCLHYVGRTSMQVVVEVFSEDPMTGNKTYTSNAVLTYVALDDKGKPVPVPRLIIETEEDKRRFESGEKRRQRHLENRAT